MARGSPRTRSASEAKSVRALDVMHRQTRDEPRLLWCCSHSQRYSSTSWGSCCAASVSDPSRTALRWSSWIGRAHAASSATPGSPARSLSFLTIAQCPTSPASAMVRNSKPSSASSSPSRYVVIISVASFLTSRALRRIAVFLPSVWPAISVQRRSVSRASSRILSSVPASSRSLRASMRLTFVAAPCDAIARPRTSPSLLSSFVSSAIWPPESGTGTGAGGQAPGRAPARRARSADGVLDLLHHAVAAVVGDDPRRLLREPGGFAQLGGDLHDLLRLGARGEDGGLRRQVIGRRALGLGLVGDAQVLAGLGVRPVEDGGDLLEVGRREAVELEVLATLDVRLALGDLLRRDPR